MKEFTVSRWFLLMCVLQPVIFASIAFYLFQAGGRSGTLLYAALGAGMMGIWSSTLFGSGGALQWNRWQGTLELLVGSPPPFIVVLLPLTLATSVTGAYALLATLLWGRLFFGVPLHFAHPFAFVFAVPAAVLALGLMGLLMASSFVLYRHANALSNLLEYPVWVATGLLFPIALLPGWVRPISWLLAPSWGIAAIRNAALGHGAVWFPIAMCCAVALAYLVVGGVLSPAVRTRRPRPRDALAHLMASGLRIFFVGGLISFRALFNWIKPYIYVPTMFGSPLFQIVFFAYLGRYAHTGQSDAFFIVGNAVQVCAMSSVYGMTMAVANERQSVKSQHVV